MHLVSCDPTLPVMNGSKTRPNLMDKVKQGSRAADGHHENSQESVVEMKLGWVVTRTVQSQAKSMANQVSQVS